MPLRDQQIDLLLSYSSEFRARLRRINSFTSHRSSIGSSHEGILRRFLQQYVPRRFSVSEGFITDNRGQTSSQCDIVIWSSLDNAPLYSEGDFVIVPAKAVEAVIEVKTSLNKEILREAFEQLRPLHELSEGHIHTAIFAFESLSLKKICEHIVFDLDISVAEAVDSICSLDGWALLRLGFEQTETPGLGMLGIPRAIQSTDESPLLPFLPTGNFEGDDGSGMAAFIGNLFIALGLQDHNLQMMGDIAIRINSPIIAGIANVDHDTISREEIRTILQRYIDKLEKTKPKAPSSEG